MNDINEESNIKEILKTREKNYLDCTQKILEKFLPQLKDSIEEVVYNDEEIDFLVKNVYPIADNLNYLSIVALVATHSVGDVVPLQLDSGETKPVEITEENYWNMADHLVVNIPITVLESQDKDTITEFLQNIYDEGNVMDDSDNSKDVAKFDSSEFDESGLDEVQKKLLDINYSGNNKEH